MTAPGATPGIGREAVPPRPGVSVLVCTRNGAARLPATLAFLAAQDDPGVPWEVLLVDNGSTDGSASVARSAWPDPFTAPLRILHHAPRGVAGARMAGLAACRGELVVFVDDDNHLSPDYLAEAVRFMGEYPGAAMAGGISDLPPRLPIPPWFPRFSTYFAVGRKEGEGAMSVDRSKGLLWGAGAVLRKEALDRLLRLGWTPFVNGPIHGGEDTELCLAFLSSGWELWYTPSLRMEHALEPSRLRWDVLCRLARDYGRRWTDLHPYILGAREDDRSCRAWWSYQMWKALRKVFRGGRLARYAVSRFSGEEGDHEVVRLHTALGEATGLWAGRRGYRERVEAVRTALWRSPPGRPEEERRDGGGEGGTGP